MKFLKIILFCCLIFNSAFAFEKTLSNRADERRAQNLFAKIKCVVCQGQTIKDSGSDFAIFMRNIIRKEIQANKTDAEIISLISHKYGKEAIIKTQPSFLWLIPLLFFIVGIILLRKASQHSKS